ncbi:hypothetical protein HanXRQr2_Chr03g0123671 [Helianthus annuus]|uniref:Uncharacterized protein n=1 Tax=Helianthus annuus TaxID=4232 RepID=A0A9K3JHV4_HELAN|nr:hypothetical protein HanXRQr2_Chr03g0123671 [Helianthus annuus]KAJ0944762.1 hypothetical protein HanPSC8_Chr03g0120421 [Helianthus annuus]
MHFSFSQQRSFSFSITRASFITTQPVTSPLQRGHNGLLVASGFITVDSSEVKSEFDPGDILFATWKRSKQFECR